MIGQDKCIEPVNHFRSHEGLFVLAFVVFTTLVCINSQRSQWALITILYAVATLKHAFGEIRICIALNLHVDKKPLLLATFEPAF